MIRCVVVIGPSGNGKSTLARELANRMGWRFIEGDDHHPPANIAKMARGEPLTDTDREPFIDAIGHALAQANGAVAACSALKRTYRDRLRQLAGRPVLFVWPDVPRAELLRRMSARRGHFMPASLLNSQIGTFEQPDAAECAMALDGCRTPADLAQEVAAALTKF